MAVIDKAGCLRFAANMAPRKCLLLARVVALTCAACVIAGRVSALEQARAVDAAYNAEDDRRLAEFLVGTKWLMYEIPGRIVEFGENGKFELEDWKRQGIEARWKVTGPKQVTVTVISQKFRNLTATLNFDDRLGFFTGQDLDHKRQITKSPRINSVPNDPADPNNWKR